ncbi:MAG: metallophosphoesterase [Clostridia bacterium]|nr:metallophosphoesterase [Clostridia bacterium]
MECYIADTHFGHTQILEECRPQFKTIEEMNETIINNINRKMTRNDTLYILGDFAYRSKTPPIEFLKAIKPKKVLILGNHDAWVKKLTDEEKKKYIIGGVHNELRIKKNGIELYLCHYPRLAWNRSHYFGTTFSICGHIHDRKDGAIAAELFPFVKNQFNAGVDINNYEPVTFEELIKNNTRFYQRSYTDNELEILQDAIKRLSK